MQETPQPADRKPAVATAEKIKDLDELAALVAELRASGKRVVHCHGVFDLLHIGHIRHFEEARRHGDVLIVTLTPDPWVNKGLHRPAFNQDLRAETLATLSCVDYVAINRWPTAIETIQLLRPHYYAKGAEFRNASMDVTGAVQKEIEAIMSVGGQMVFTDDVVYSSSTLINRHLSLLTKEAADFLVHFARRYSTDDILGYLEAARPTKVLVLGETILDEYHYCETLGKSAKEPILAVRLCSSEQFAGGSLAVANHLASFCEQVRLASFLGQQDTQETFIREKLHPRVDPCFFYLPGVPTIVKRRFINNYPFQKLFEVYVMGEQGPQAPDVEHFHAFLAEELPRHDLVIVADYGHGMFDARGVELLCELSPCLAVNTQANAGNHGFNTISKYPRADYVCLSEYELRLEARQPGQDLRQLVQRMTEKLGCRKMMVTRGKSGVLCYSRTEGFVQVPALTSHFTDRIGAGDAVFAVTSLCMAKDAPAEIMGMIGNAVGALAVSVVGNRSAIDRTALMRSIISLMK